MIVCGRKDGDDRGDSGISDRCDSGGVGWCQRWW